MNKIVAIVGALAVLNGFAAEKKESPFKQLDEARAAFNKQEGEALRSGASPAACDVECLALVGNGYIAVLAVNATPQMVTVTIDGKFRSHFSCETRTVRCAADGRTALCDCREDWSVPSERIRIYAEANTFQVTVVPIR